MSLGWLFGKKFVRVENGLRWFRIGMNAADTPGTISRIIDILLIRDNNQLNALFLNVFISCLYMFQAGRSGVSF